MGRVGDAISITLNGTKFAIPKDTTPNVIKGGETITETQGFGDGTADACVSIVTPKITGVKCKVSEANKDAFETARKKTDIPIVLQCIAKSYECTGCMVGEIEIDTTKQITGEFEIHVTDGSGIRET